MFFMLHNSFLPKWGCIGFDGIYSVVVNMSRIGDDAIILVRTEWGYERS
jgi:hypothetical protein